MKAVRVIIFIFLLMIVLFMLASQYIKLDEPVIISNKYGDRVLDLYNFRAMTVNPWLIIIKSGLDEKVYKAEVAHEMTHINQMNDLGFIRFTIDTWYSKIKSRSLCDYESWYEREAYANQYDILFEGWKKGKASS